MKISEFIEKFAEALDVMDPSMLCSQTKFKELDEWSSLAVLSVIAMADEEYHKEIEGGEIKKAKTIQDLFELITR